MSNDSTRLLVLGATRQEQPATGYAVMRELSGWDVQEWASVNPGSIYGALRALVKDGYLVESTETATVAKGRKNGARYRLTDEGESAFTHLLRTALWEVSPYQAAPFMTALCFLVQLTRDEVIAAIEERIARLEGHLRQLDFDELQVLGTGSTRPSHSVEFMKLAAGRLDGELEFTRALLVRLRSGSYAFAGEM